MMKKAISLFLAASVLCLTTSALADIETGTVTRTGGAIYNGKTTLQSDYNNKSNMPAFRPGDTINFDVTGVTSGKELTVISYKYGAESDGLVDGEVQYINQYTLASASQPISYKIREQASGVYKIVFNDTVNTVATFYYKVGNATAVMLNKGGQTAGTPYLSLQADDGTWSIGFLGKVTIDSADISLTDIGAHPGFTVTESGGQTKTYAFGHGVNSSKTVAGLQNTTQIAEVSGSYSFIYGLTIYNVTADDEDEIE
ncbi:MAG: hypothetical protein IK072_01160, partial [Clostridia bacterium]|nr:hypothetical protein [Clostridia bacterium]